MPNNNNRRRVRRRQTTTTTVVTRRSRQPTGHALVPARPPMQKVIPNNRRRVRNRGNRRPPISREGVNFLKCAFASPDFGIDPGQGIPDNFHGNVVSIKDCSSVPLTFDATKDTYILKAPVPGVAYFVGVADPGTQCIEWDAVYYPTYDVNFGDGTLRTNNYTQYRYSSASMGLYSTSNFMQFQGAVQAWRVDLNMVDALHDPASSDIISPASKFIAMTGATPATGGSLTSAGVTDYVRAVGTPPVFPSGVSIDTFTDTSGAGRNAPTSNALGAGPATAGYAPILRPDSASNQPTTQAYTLAEIEEAITGGLPIVTRGVQGLSSVTPLPPRDNYSDSFQRGAFSFCIDREEFEWKSFVYADKLTEQGAVSLTLNSEGSKPLLGLGNLDTVVFKISASGGTFVNTAILKVWDCYELKVKTNSPLYQHSHLSPAHDPVALHLYREVAYKLPVAVPSAENAIQWRKVAEMLRMLFKAGSYLPGPIGLISGGAEIITSGIEALFV